MKREIVFGFIAGVVFSLLLPTGTAQAGGGFYEDVKWMAVSLDRIAHSLEKERK